MHFVVLDTKRSAVCLALGLLFIASPAFAAAKCRAQGIFHITSTGPWNMHIEAQPGATCRSKFSSGGIVFRQLSLVTAPARGRVSLSGLNYAYTAPASPGSESFMLRLCGAVQGQREGCSDLRYNVVIN
jgi:hypothetical protein